MKEATCIFISGHADLSGKQFIQYYAPGIKAAIQDGCTFVVGDCPGTDEMAQTMLARILPVERHGDVKVFYKGEKPGVIVSEKFIAVPAFHTHEEAAAAMTLCSDIDMAFLLPNRFSSLTGQNVLRRITLGYDYEKYLNAKHSNKAFWKFIFDTKNNSAIESVQEARDGEA